MRVVFMGTPQFAVPTLQALYEEGYDLVGVYTQPDRPKGRGKKVQPSPIKEKALAYNLPVVQPKRIKDPEAVETLKDLMPDLIVVAAYGQILSQEILDIPPLGCINVHASLLPKYRGAAPIQWAIINGEEETGITTMLMNEGLDTGDMLLKEELAISTDDNFGTIHDKLSLIGAQLLIKTIKLLEKGELPRTKQNDELATYAPLITKDHELINWSKSAQQIFNHVRGMNPQPGAFTYLNEKVLKIWQTELYHDADNIEKDSNFICGEVVVSDPKRGVIINTGCGYLKILEIQLQGGKRVSVSDYLRGNKLPPGTILGKACV